MTYERMYELAENGDKKYYEHRYHHSPVKSVSVRLEGPLCDWNGSPRTIELAIESIEKLEKLLPGYASIITGKNVAYPYDAECYDVSECVGDDPLYRYHYSNFPAGWFDDLFPAIDDLDVKPERTEPIGGPGASLKDFALSHGCDFLNLATGEFTSSSGASSRYW